MQITFSKQQLEQIKEYAGYLFSPKEIAVLLEVDPNRFLQVIRQSSHPASMAYNKGKMETVLAIRKQEIELARVGSPMAVEMVKDFMIDQKLGE